MGEEKLLRHIYERSVDLSRAYEGIVVGPGDDCAVVKVGNEENAGRGSGGELLLKVDQLVEGIHFLPGTELGRVSRKAMGRAVSDIAAMAGTPLYGLAACTLPVGFPSEQADELFDQVAMWARRFNAPLVGGDIAQFTGVKGAGSAGKGGLLLSITVVGRVHEKRGAVLRSTAKVGDDVYVTGALGGSFGSGMGRHLDVEPRVKEGAWLAGVLGGSLHAMMDVSDGLGIDAARMGRASGVKLMLEEERIPVHDDVAVGGEPVERVKHALGDGEDFELLFAVEGGVDVPRTCELTGTKITRVGRVERVDGNGGERGEGGQKERAGAFVCWIDGSRTNVEKFGWEHGRE